MARVQQDRLQKAWHQDGSPRSIPQERAGLGLPTLGHQGDANREPSRVARLPALRLDNQMGWTLSACGPLVPWLAVNSTRWLSWRLR